MRCRSTGMGVSCRSGSVSMGVASASKSDTASDSTVWTKESA